MINPVILPLEDENTVITELTSGYDFNDNNLLDVLAIAWQVDSKGNKLANSSRLVLLELRPNGLLKLLWEYKPAQGQFIDVEIVDFEGDGRQAFAAICSHKYSDNIENRDWLYIFEGQGNKIVRKYEEINLKYPEVRAEFLDKGDFNGDGLEDLLISAGSPSRAAYIVRLKNYNLKNDFQIGLDKISLSSGISRFRAIAANIDSLPGDEIVMIREQDKIQITGYDYQLGSIQGSDFIFSQGRMKNLQLNQIVASNVKDNKFDNIILPFRDGENYLLSWKDQSMTSVRLPIEKTIRDIRVKDLNYNGRDEIYYLSKNEVEIYRLEAQDSTHSQNIEFNSNLYFNPYFTDVELLALEFTIDTRDPFGDALLVPYYNKNFYKHGLSYWLLKEKIDFENKELEESGFYESTTIETSKDGLAEFERINHIINKYSKLDGSPTSLANYENEEILITRNYSQTKHIEYDYTIHPGDTFNYHIDSLHFDNMSQISIIAPGDITYSPDSSKISWAPEPSFVGENNIIFTNEKESKIISLYVNSPPQITNIPNQYYILQLGETFAFNPQIKDKNKDANLIYKMVKYPEGVEINPTGLIRWKPAYFQKDWYDFKMIVSDGMDSTFVVFSIFVNHPPTIKSQFPSSVQVGENFQHSIEIEDNKGGYLTIHNKRIRIDRHNNSEICEFELVHDAPDQYIKKFNTIKNKVIHIINAIKVDNSIILIASFQNKRPRPNEVIKSFFNSINMPIPIYKLKREYFCYNYAIKRAPDNLTIAEDGTLQWTPQKYQLGWNQISYIVNDGYFTDEYSDSVFVNSPPKITKTPDTLIYSDSLWKCKVSVLDQNQDAGIKYKLIKAPSGVHISETGVIKWFPRNINYRKYSFGIVVSDGLAADTGYANVIVDQAPEIVSRPNKMAYTDIEYTYKIKAIDEAGDSLRYKAIKIPKNAILDEKNGYLSWKPRSNQQGNNKIVLQAIDSHAAYSLQSFDIKVIKSDKTRNKVIITSLLSATTIIGLLYFLVF
ncbi:MAG: hypothetical protein K9M80_06555 [Candidatus Marinimicrobia bacterium]|nr:hypothetical protein [Candidatus Neomarinimicrobiota bacterium]